jgi:hypothetical protein
VKIINPPKWNGTFNEKRNILIYGECDSCGNRVQNQNIFNDLDEYRRFLDK